jgi:hypothetical protein
MFVAIYDSENFVELANENNGYKFALSRLDNVKSLDSEDDFNEFIDSIDI